jgi:hypothetical protein
MSPFIEELEKRVASICRQASFRKIKYIEGMQAMQNMVTKHGLEPSMLPEEMFCPVCCLPRRQV